MPYMMKPGKPETKHEKWSDHCGLRKCVPWVPAVEPWPGHAIRPVGGCPGHPDCTCYASEGP